MHGTNSTNRELRNKIVNLKLQKIFKIFKVNLVNLESTFCYEEKENKQKSQFRTCPFVFNSLVNARTMYHKM